MSASDDRPSWACQRYGDWEHDWMDCPECLAAYERWMLTDPSRPGTDALLSAMCEEQATRLQRLARKEAR